MFTTLVVGLAFAIAAPGEKTPPKKENPIAGIWECVDQKRGGINVPPLPGGLTIEFTKDGKLLITAGEKGKPAIGSYKVDAKKNPAHIDWIPPANDEKDFEFRGIFKIEDGKLTIALAAPNTERLTEFVSPVGSMNSILIFESKKPAKK